jgi:hypothetical protein
MAKRIYQRDKRGRFASTGTKSSRRRIKVKKQRPLGLGSKTIGEIHVRQDKHGNVTVVKKRPRSKRKIAKRAAIGAVLAGAALGNRLP